MQMSASALHLYRPDASRPVPERTILALRCSKRPPSPIKFSSTLVQYNEQIDNLNLNMRFQWRYQPVSDLFVVYTDNYIPGTWKHRNRALVLKLTYWLN